jgi:hypothetical protein
MELIYSITTYPNRCELWITENQEHSRKPLYSIRFQHSEESKVREFLALHIQLNQPQTIKGIYEPRMD